ncbi:MAG TPA: DegT/DnrJ/EryC1/StrS family aminotransferase [Thermoanaerobaculia bacterium]|nr:DegT/DnrJ/EryC1/StrS family aminotransferase [Thermoanaerobaculia bacterium]
MSAVATQIPLVDLKAQHAEIAGEVTRGMARVMEETAFILGPAVAEFEQAFARFCDVPHCIGVGNGTDAIELIVRALGLGPGDEVLVPANTFIATALGVLRAGPSPVLVDCDEHHLMDPQRIEEKITPRTRAILPVHLFGQIANMEAIGRIAAAHGFLLLEDAAQCQGARRHGRSAGTFGAAAAVSFYPGKNLGAYGDAGAVLTQSAEIAAHVRHLRNWGSERKYHHPEIGFNSRLDTIQAVVLSAKLARLAAWNEARRQAAARYDRLLADVPGVETPRTLEGNEHVWHLYVVRVPRRDQVLERLQAEGIGAGIHYPVPLHLHGALSHLGYQQGDFPMAEKAAEEILSLPLYPHITEEQQGRVAEALRRAV